MTRGAAIRLSASERWFGEAAPIGRVSRTMALVAAASVLGHLAMVGTVAVTGRPVVAPSTEIAVEIVQGMPKPAPEAAKPAPEPAKSEPTKAELTKPDPAKSEPESAKAEPAKPETTKPETTKIAKFEPPAPKARPAPKSSARDEAAEERKLAALQQELESLRAEQAQIQAERAAEAAATQGQQGPSALRDTGLGPLPDSFQAVALPAVGDGAAEAASYEAIVFSALAKAKGIGRRQGLPGSAGVRFAVDATGRVMEVELVHRSGIASLDAEALDIVRRASPFPPPPQGAQRSFEANVNFVTESAR